VWVDTWPCVFHDAGGNYCIDGSCVAAPGLVCESVSCGTGTSPSGGRACGYSGAKCYSGQACVYCENDGVPQGYNCQPDGACSAGACTELWETCGGGITYCVPPQVSHVDNCGGQSCGAPCPTPTGGQGPTPTLPQTCDCPCAATTCVGEQCPSDNCDGVMCEGRQSSSDPGTQAYNVRRTSEVRRTCFPPPPNGPIVF
jgi:hypothetical protein